MRILVIYESMFGNTHDIADAIGLGLGHIGSVDVVPVGEVSPDDLQNLDLLVVGGPTHMHGMARPSSRKAAKEDADKDDAVELEADALGIGLREWFTNLPKNPGTFVAAFDTRVDKPVLLVGSAAKGISKRLRRLGFNEICEPESFFVDDLPGPLHEGEVDRAQAWGTTVAHELMRLKRQTS